ncbi:hypothetical protein DID75_02135 [Candidatus Marinamargulisbacteria bacterium SCGC AG-410-N11]|nr:hypothetical protein DID75_02135 [Candidatus Marinamargulisbacteria bacterium SCGC AG-410-N11]
MSFLCKIIANNLQKKQLISLSTQVVDNSHVIPSNMMFNIQSFLNQLVYTLVPDLSSVTGISTDEFYPPYLQKVDAGNGRSALKHIEQTGSFKLFATASTLMPNQYGDWMIRGIPGLETIKTYIEIGPGEGQFATSALRHHTHFKTCILFDQSKNMLSKCVNTLQSNYPTKEIRAVPFNIIKPFTQNQDLVAPKDALIVLNELLDDLPTENIVFNNGEFKTRQHAISIDIRKFENMKYFLKPLISKEIINYLNNAKNIQYSCSNLVKILATKINYNPKINLESLIDQIISTQTKSFKHKSSKHVYLSPALLEVVLKYFPMVKLDHFEPPYVLHYQDSTVKQNTDVYQFINSNLKENLNDYFSDSMKQPSKLSSKITKKKKKSKKKNKKQRKKQNAPLATTQQPTISKIDKTKQNQIWACPYFKSVFNKFPLSSTFLVLDYTCSDSSLNNLRPFPPIIYGKISNFLHWPGYVNWTLSVDSRQLKSAASSVGFMCLEEHLHKNQISEQEYRKLNPQQKKVMDGMFTRFIFKRFPDQTNVILKGLKNKSYNGLNGIINGLNADHFRYGVTITLPSGNTKKIGIKPQNLTFINHS